MRALFQKYGLAICVAGGMGVLVGLHALGLFPGAGLHDLSRLVGAPVTVLEGTVLDFPSTRWYQTRFILDGHAVPLTGFTGRVVVTLKFPDYSLMPGDRVRVRGWLSAPRSASALRTFDEQEYWSSHGVFALLRVWDRGGFELVHRPRWSLERLAFRFHHAFRQFWEARLPEDAAALLLGITIGAREGMSKQLKDACIRAGVYHMVVVSGQNVGMIILAIAALFTALRVPRRHLLWVCAVPIIFYALAVGSDPPVARATVMAIGGLLVLALGRDTLYWYSLVWAAGFLLLIEPAMLFGASFQLSFMATASILAVLPWSEAFLIEKSFLLRWFLRAGVFSLAVQIGLWPLLAHYFGKLSLIGFLANLVILPLASLILFLGLLLGTLGLIVPEALPFFLIKGIDSILNGTLWLITTLAGFEQAMVPVARPSLGLACAYYIVLFGILWAVRWRAKNAPKTSLIANHWTPV